MYLLHPAHSDKWAGEEAQWVESFLLVCYRCLYMRWGKIAAYKVCGRLVWKGVTQNVLPRPKGEGLSYGLEDCGDGSLSSSFSPCS